MRIKARALVVLVLVLLLPRLGLAESPSDAKGGPDEVTVTGCVTKGVEGGCSVLTDTQGKIYSFADGPAVSDKCYEITGTKAMGFCMQGTQLDVKKLEVSEIDCCMKK